MHTSNCDNGILFTIDFENFISENLEIRELVVCSLLMEGYSMIDIQKHQRISYTYVKKIVGVIRKKFLKFKQEQNISSKKVKYDSIRKN